jgi:hypothetical protein
VFLKVTEVEALVKKLDELVRLKSVLIPVDDDFDLEELEEDEIMSEIVHQFHLLEDSRPLLTGVITVIGKIDSGASAKELQQTLEELPDEVAVHSSLNLELFHRFARANFSDPHLLVASLDPNGNRSDCIGAFSAALGNDTILATQDSVVVKYLVSVARPGDCTVETFKEAAQVLDESNVLAGAMKEETHAYYVLCRL